MAESTDTAVKEKDEISSEAVSVDTDGFGASAMTEEVVLDVKDLQTQFTTRWGTVKVRYPSLATNLEGVFAAGDIVRGASLVVWAIRDGRDAAESIARFLDEKAAGASAPAVAAE